MFGDLPTAITSSEKKPPLHKNHGVLLEGSDVIFELPVTNRRTFFLTAQHSGASLACRCAAHYGQEMRIVQRKSRQHDNVAVLLFG